MSCVLGVWESVCVCVFVVVVGIYAHRRSQDTYKNVSWDRIVPHLFSLIMMLCVGDEPLCTIVWWLWCGRRMVDMKLVSQAFVANDSPRRWCVGWIGLQHKYRWKCCRNTPDTQYRATGLTQEFRKLCVPIVVVDAARVVVVVNANIRLLPPLYVHVERQTIVRVTPSTVGSRMHIVYIEFFA